MNAKTALAIGVLILGVALFVPQLIDASKQDVTAQTDHGENVTRELTGNLEVRVDDIRTNQQDALVTVRDTKNADRAESTIDLGNSETFQLAGGNVTVTLVSIYTENSLDRATLESQYTPYFAWNPAAITFFQNIELVLALVGFIIAGALVAKGAKI